MWIGKEEKSIDTLRQLLETKDFAIE